jgi:hypothetical protein
MSKDSFVHYYVQLQKDDEAPEIVYHTYDGDYKEYYYKFDNKKQAKSFAEAEKKITPEFSFRVVKCIETYSTDPWI